jgi:hypothetical protein
MAFRYSYFSFGQVLTKKRTGAKADAQAQIDRAIGDFLSR